MTYAFLRAGLVMVTVAAIVTGGQGLRAQTPIAGTPCARLTALNIPTIRIVAATAMPAGAFTPPGAKEPMTLPEFCRVEASATPVPDSEIKFEVWMPALQAWTGRFQGVGNGGYVGNIGYGALATALKHGSAVTSTDIGHSGGDLEFGLGHPEKVIDWAHRAMHVTAEAAKLITRNHLGKFPAYSYFVGCSSGGHQAMSEVQRYPDDYDGVLAGDPAFDRMNQTLAYLQKWLATHDASGASLIPTPKLALLTEGAVAACDAHDGVKDGLIDDPRSCRFDPAVLLCKGGADATCLTRTEVDAARKVYEPLRHPRTGALIYPGWLPGSEGFGQNAGQGWRQMLLDPPKPMRHEVLSYFVFQNPAWDFRTIDWDRDVAFAAERLPHLSAVNPDLTAFRAAGGKLLMYSGWADPLLPGSNITNYYDQVVKTMGAKPPVQDFARLFMVPGMGHCGGGPGPNVFDALTPLEAWVEKGTAPASIVASSIAGGATRRTRPLCPYPQVARWSGKGSSDEAANFSCVAPGRAFR